MIHSIISRMLVAAWLAAQIAAHALAAEAQPLKVMTFNLRYASPKPPNSWPERRPVVRECIEKFAPDIFGTQEGLYLQLKDLTADLPAYDWIGLGRDGGSRGEFMAVFYRKSRFEPLEFDHFWLSDTPSVVASATWGNSNRRMVTWVRFLDREARQEFYLWNTHFDHQIQPAREKSAALIRERVDALKTTLPVLLIGDFNATPENRAYTTLVTEGGFTDTWVSARERRNEGISTFHDFGGPKKGGFRIDWILARGPVTADTAEVVTFNKNGQYPSDHFPVMAWLRWNAAAANP